MKTPDQKSEGQMGEKENKVSQIASEVVSISDDESKKEENKDYLPQTLQPIDSQKISSITENQMNEINSMLK